MIETKYRTFWPRFWAGWIDSLVFIPVAAINHFIWRIYDLLPIGIMILWYIVHSLSGYAYNIFMHGKYGQTLGKMATHVKVLDLSENRLTFSQAIKRDIIPLALLLIITALNIPKITSGINMYGHEPDVGVVKFISNYVLTIWFLAEIVTMLFSNRRRAVHDLIAGSVVIKLPQENSTLDRSLPAAPREL